MGKRLEMGGTLRGWPMLVRRILRIITILVGLVGISYLGIAYYGRMSAPARTSKPKKETTAKAPRTPDGKIDVAALLQNADNETSFELRYNSDTDTWSRVQTPRAAGADEALYGPILDGATINSGQLHRLLKRVATTNPATDAFMQQAGEVTVGELQKSPDRYRGMQVTVRGTLRYVKEVAFAGEFEMIFEGRIEDANGNLCAFHSIRKPPMVLGERAVIHGFFMQLLTEGTKAGGQVKTPLLVTSEPLGTLAEDATWGATGVMFGIVAGLLVMYFVMMFWLRRKSQQRNPILEARRKVRGLVRRPLETEDTEEQEEHEHGSP